MKKDELKSSSQ